MVDLSPTVLITVIKYKGSKHSNYKAEIDQLDKKAKPNYALSRGNLNINTQVD